MDLNVTERRSITEHSIKHYTLRNKDTFPGDSGTIQSALFVPLLYVFSS